MDPINQGVTPQLPLPVKSFGPGGQRFISNLFSGFVIDVEKTHSLFTFAQNSSPLAPLLTNMREAGRIGSTMNFTAMQMCVRAFKIGDTVPTSQEIHDLKRYIGSLNLEIYLGSNTTRCAEFTGAHLLNVMDFASQTTLADTFGAVASPVNTGSWMNLPEMIGMQESVELSGQAKCNLAAVPASLYAVASSWVVLVIFGGIKQTK